MALQREKVYLKRIIKDIIASLDIWRYPQFSKRLLSGIFSRKTYGKVSLYDNCDASWGCQEDGSPGPFSWCAKKKSTIALSTAEAEYVALSHAVQEAIRLKHLVEDLGFLQLEATPIYEENQAASNLQRLIWCRLEQSISIFGTTSPGKLSSLEKSSSFTALLN